MSKTIYLDHAATTPTDPRVVKTMLPYFNRVFGNASSLHQEGRKAREIIQESRSKVAKILNARSEEIVFTGSGTESANLAIFGIARHYKDFGNHIVTSTIEHHAVLYPVERLEKKEGFKTSFIKVDPQGILDIEAFEKEIRKDTILISVIYANNEIGTIQPIKEVAEIIKEVREKREKNGSKVPVFFHTDACQAAGYLSLDVKKLGVDLLTLNGSKIYGPKGIGVLFVRSGVRLSPLVVGGGQEMGIRAGTENLAGIAGLAKALEISHKIKKRESLRQEKLRDYFIKEILRKIPGTILNGHPRKRLPNNVNITILDIEGEAMLLWLDKYGIYASTGSACDSKSLEPSHVILALARPYEHAHGSLRFTLGRETRKQDIDYVLKVLPGIVEKLRKISPLKLKCVCRK